MSAHTNPATRTTSPVVFIATCPECGAPLMPTSGRLALVECGACGWLDLDEDELSDMLVSIAGR